MQTLQTQDQNKYKVQINKSIFSKELDQNDQFGQNKIDYNTMNDEDFIFKSNQESFTIQYGVNVIRTISIFYIICSLCITGVSTAILVNGGTHWSGHLPYFVVKKSQIDIILSNILLLLSILQIKTLAKLSLCYLQLITLIIFSSFIISSSLSGALLQEVTSAHSKIQTSGAQSSCEKNFRLFWPQDLLEDYNIAQSKLCSHDCPCKIQQENLFKFQSENPSAIISEKGHQSLSSCSSTLNTINPKSIIVIQYLEERWSCSNICKPTKHFLFRQIDDYESMNFESCFQILGSQTNNLMKLIFLPGLIIGVLLLLGWVFELYCVIEIKKYKNYKILIMEELSKKDAQSVSDFERFSLKGKIIPLNDKQDKQEIVSANAILSAKTSTFFQLNKLNIPQELITFDKQYSYMNDDKTNGQFSRLVSPKNSNHINFIQEIKNSEILQNKGYFSNEITIEKNRSFDEN